MKVEISNKDFVTYLILLFIVIAIVLLFVKMDIIRHENQVNMNTQNIRNIDNYLNQQIQLKQQKAPEYKLVPKEKDKK